MRRRVAIYGSGGFITYDEQTARAQLEQWVGDWEIPRVKIKIGEAWGARPERDLARTAFARAVIGDGVALFVDANGGYSRKQAVRMGHELADAADISWFEEPVSSDDLMGLRVVRDALDVDVAAGEYGYDETYFARMVAAGGGGLPADRRDPLRRLHLWLRAAAVAGAQGLEVSAHCAPNLHAHVGVSVPNMRHIEYFHDHHRIETDAVRRCARSPGRAPSAAPRCPGPRHDPQGVDRRALSALMRAASSALKRFAAAELGERNELRAQEVEHGRNRSISLE